MDTEPHTSAELTDTELMHDTAAETAPPSWLPTIGREDGEGEIKTARLGSIVSALPRKVTVALEPVTLS